MRDITLKNSRVSNADVVRMLQSYKANVQRYLGCRVHLALLPSGEIDWYLSGHPNELACLNDQVRAGLFIKFFDRWYNQLPRECRTILFHCYINHDFEPANTMSAWLEYEWGRMKFRTLPVRRLAVLFDCSTSKLYKMKRFCLERLTGIINEEAIKAKAEELLAKKLPEYEFSISIAYLEGEEPTVVADNGKGEMVQDVDLEKKINEIINRIR